MFSFCVYLRSSSYQRVADLFIERFANRPPILNNGIVSTTCHFKNNAKDLPHSGRSKTATSKYISIDMVIRVIEEPHLSIRKLATDHDISKRSMGKVLKSTTITRYILYMNYYLRMILLTI